EMAVDRGRHAHVFRIGPAQGFRAGSLAVDEIRRGLGLGQQQDLTGPGFLSDLYSHGMGHAPDQEKPHEFPRSPRYGILPDSNTRKHRTRGNETPFLISPLSISTFPHFYAFRP